MLFLEYKQLNKYGRLCNNRLSLAGCAHVQILEKSKALKKVLVP